MKRSIFFWLEKLKISRAERRAITTLIVLLGMLVAVNAMLSPATPFEQDRYDAIDEEFRRHTAMLQQKERQLMARYQLGGATDVTDTLPKPPNADEQPFVPAKPININTADVPTLQHLPGIGPAYAERIVERRRRNGPFTAKDELLQIKGIGEARLKKIKPFIKIGAVAQRPSALALDSLPLPKMKESNAPEKKAGAGGPAIVLNVNTAGKKELQKLPGIGPAYAKRITQYRRENGPFRQKDELLKIKGIGKKRLAKIKPFIKLTDQ